MKLLLGAVGSKNRPAPSPSLARVAARCMCGLLSALHHFNYSADLMQAMVPLMVHQDPQLRQSGCGAIREVLVHDTEGKVAVAAVQLVSLATAMPCPTSTHQHTYTCVASIVSYPNVASVVLVLDTEGEVAIAAVQLVSLSHCHALPHKRHCKHSVVSPCHQWCAAL